MINSCHFKTIPVCQPTAFFRLDGQQWALCSSIILNKVARLSVYRENLGWQTERDPTLAYHLFKMRKKCKASMELTLSSQYWEGGHSNVTWQRRTRIFLHNVQTADRYNIGCFVCNDCIADSSRNKGFRDRTWFLPL